ncbi:MAG: hypothetical protein AAF556_08910 [Pseudomonadota bacterium]
MIDVLIAEGKTPILVGEEADLQGASLITIDEAGKSIWMEQADTTRKNLGVVADEVIASLTDDFDEVVLVALDGDDVAWSQAVDLGAFQNAPRPLPNETIKRLMDEMAKQEVTFAISLVEDDKAARKKRRRTRP